MHMPKRKQPLAERTMPDGFVLRVEVNAKGAADIQPLQAFGTLITPPINEDYWLLRVPVSDTQAVVAFPKFTTIGVGFQQEEDWNTNLPARVGHKRLWNHIKHNKGSDDIPDDRCVEALKLLIAAVDHYFPPTT
jgi:hypothetical protein